MTVKELIKCLEHFSEDSEIIIVDPLGIALTLYSEVTEENQEVILYTYNKAWE